MSQCSSQPAPGIQAQLGKKVHFLLLLELSYFRHVLAKMPQDRAVEQCDSLPPSSLALCTISRIKDEEQLLFIQGGSARFKKLKPKGFLRMLLCFHWERKQLCHTESPDSWWHQGEQNRFRTSAEPRSSFQMPPLPCWMKPLIIWAKGYNCWG